MSVRMIDCWVNVTMGGPSPDWLIRVKEDYFRAGDEFNQDIAQEKLLADMDAAGVAKSIISIGAKDPEPRVLQFAKDSGLEERFDDINPNGGGISLGHPLGATGARVTATLLNELERREARYGVACMCIGFGQAIAAVVERV